MRTAASLPRTAASLPLAGAASLLLACGVAEVPLLVDPGDPGSEPVRHAVAVLQPVGGSGVTGTVTFARDDEGPGLRVEATLRGAPAGPHAFHVHLLGDCRAADGTSAGTHFNFAGPSRQPPADIERITGNLGEIASAGPGQVARAGPTPVETARLQGPFSVVGRSVVVHERGNDPESPPMGAAGGRIACGVIGIADAPETG
jgi:Cu-Zn family superoxide dismutase